MIAILSVERDDGAWPVAGGEGRIALQYFTDSDLVRACSRLQGMSQGRAVQVEEFEQTVYGHEHAPLRIWVYHCACDLDRPCAYHKDKA